MKKHATTIVLLVVLLALGAWLWSQRDSVTEGEKKRRENSVFSAWRREELSRFEIQHEGETIVLERDAKKDSTWRMTAPRADRCDQAAVERLLTMLEFAGVKRRPTETADLGLDSPRARGSVTMGGLVLRFALGEKSPRPEGSAYFRVEGEAPIVVGKEVADALLDSSDKYRDRSIVPYLSIELAKFEVKRRSGAGFVLERVDARSFKAGGVLAARDAVDKVWAALAEMRAESFPKEDDADRLTASPRVTIVMTPKENGKPPAELVIGEPCPGHPDDVVVLRRAPTRAVACAPMGVLDALSLDSAAFAELRPFSLRADEIEELRLESGKRVIEIARKGVGFHQREPQDRDVGPAEAEAATELLSRIATARAKSASKGGAFAPTGRAKIRAGDHEELVEIGSRVLPQPDGPSTPQPVVLRRSVDGAELDVSPLVVRLLTPRDTTFAPLALTPESRRVTRVVLRCGTPQELVDDGHGFQFVEPKELPADGSITQLVDAIMRGKVDLWVADSREGFPLGDDACRVVLGFEDKNAPLTVRFEGDYGSVDGANRVFLANPGYRELAHRIYVSRAATRAPMEDIAHVKATRAGKPVTLDDETLKNAVAALFADEVVSIGKHAMPNYLVVEVQRGEAGPPKRIACASPWDGKCQCTTSDLPDVTFTLTLAKLAPLLGLATDGGAH
jgi:hypothetical protein